MQSITVGLGSSSGVSRGVGVKFIKQRCKLPVVGNLMINSGRFQSVIFNILCKALIAATPQEAHLSLSPPPPMTAKLIYNGPPSLK